MALSQNKVIAPTSNGLPSFSPSSICHFDCFPVLPHPTTRRVPLISVALLAAVPAGAEVAEMITVVGPDNCRWWYVLSRKQVIFLHIRHIDSQIMSDLSLLLFFYLKIAVRELSAYKMLQLSSKKFFVPQRNSWLMLVAIRIPHPTSLPGHFLPHYTNPFELRHGLQRSHWPLKSNRSV